jgi:2',5'-phosphodiesterase
MTCKQNKSFHQNNCHILQFLVIVAAIHTFLHATTPFVTAFTVSIVPPPPPLPSPFTSSSEPLQMSISSATTQATPLVTKLRVVSYNVLSSHLANPSSYPTYNPEYLDAKYRLRHVIKKLEQEMVGAPVEQRTSMHDNSGNENRSTIFCLQEVSYDWAGALHTFFAQHKYHVVTGLYGKKFNGYMGILTAYPIERLDTMQVDICRLSDTYTDWPAARPKDQPTTITAITYRRLSGLLRSSLQYMGLVAEEPKEPECHWNSAERRYNVLVSIVLQDKKSQQQFVIGNYHMPCVYYDEKVMILHSDLCLSHVQKIAATTLSQEPESHATDTDQDSNETSVVTNADPPIPAVRRPYVLAGDFNIKPLDTAYKLLTSGTIDPSDPAYPTPPKHLLELSSPSSNPEAMESTTTTTWYPRQCESVRSAYAVVVASNPSNDEHTGTETTTTSSSSSCSCSNGTNEPDFTNYSKMGDNVDDPPFIDTLDYIFVSHQIHVTDVLSLPHRNDIEGPLPNEQEPSDHLMIAANLDILQ